MGIGDLISSVVRGPGPKGAKGDPGAQALQLNGAPLQARKYLNVIAPAGTLADNPGNNSIDYTPPAGGGGGNTNQANVTIGAGVINNLATSAFQFVRLGGQTGPVTITGFLSSSPPPAGQTQTLVVTNLGAFPVTITHLDARSSAGNQINFNRSGTRAASTLTLSPVGGEIVLQRDSTASAWVLLSRNWEYPRAVNVLDFPGADPTGATDSCAAFEAAIAYAAATGFDLFVPTGNYHLSRPVFLLGSGIRMRGVRNQFSATTGAASRLISAGDMPCMILGSGEAPDPTYVVRNSMTWAQLGVGASSFESCIYLNLSESSAGSMNGATSFTMSGWYNVGASMPDGATWCIMSSWGSDQSNGAGAGNGFMTLFATRSGATYTLYGSFTTSTGTINNIGIVTFSANTDHFYEIEWDGTTWRFYLDGVLVQAQPIGGAIVQQWYECLYIGVQSYTPYNGPAVATGGSLQLAQMYFGVQLYFNNGSRGIGSPFTCAVTNGSSTVPTTGGSPVGVVAVGDHWVFDSQPGTQYLIDAVTSTSITLHTTYTGTTVAATNMFKVYTPTPGTMRPNEAFLVTVNGVSTRPVLMQVDFANASTKTTPHSGWVIASNNYDPDGQGYKGATAPVWLRWHGTIGLGNYAIGNHVEDMSFQSYGDGLLCLEGTNTYVAHCYFGCARGLTLHLFSFHSKVVKCSFRSGLTGWAHRSVTKNYGILVGSEMCTVDSCDGSGNTFGLLLVSQGATIINPYFDFDFGIAGIMASASLGQVQLPLVLDNIHEYNETGTSATALLAAVVVIGFAYVRLVGKLGGANDTLLAFKSCGTVDAAGGFYPGTDGTSTVALVKCLDGNNGLIRLRGGYIPATLTCIVHPDFPGLVVWDNGEYGEGDHVLAADADTSVMVLAGAGTNVGPSDQCVLYRRHVFTSGVALTATRKVLLPLTGQRGRLLRVRNNVTLSGGGGSLQFIASNGAGGTTGTGVTLANLKTQDIYCTGTDWIAETPAV